MKGLVISDAGMRIAHDADLIQEDTKNLVFGALNDAVGKLDIGSRVPDLMYETITEATVKQVVDEVVELISIFDPRIEVESVAASIDSNGNYEGESDNGIIIIARVHRIDNPNESFDLIAQKVYTV